MNKVIKAALLGAVIVGAVLSVRFIVPAGEEKAMDKKDDGLVASTAIPPMDISSPERTETATFALG